MPSVIESEKTLHGKDRSPELQSLRGIASLVVVMHHCTFYYTDAHWIRWTSELIMNAQAAVVFFFVLSGYVLSLSLNKAAGIRTALQFYVRRIFRIYPALWVATCAALLYKYALHGIPYPSIVSSWWLPIYRGQFPSSLTLLGLFAGYGLSTPVAMWSITVELVGSLMMPLIAWSALRSRTVFLLLTAALALLAISPFAHHTWYAVYIFDFAVGAAVLVFKPELQQMLQNRRVAIWTGFASAVSLLFVRRLDTGKWAYSTDYHAIKPASFEALAAGVLISVVAYRREIVKWLTWRPLIWLGDVSYSLYLLHMVVLGTVAALGTEVFHLSVFSSPNSATAALIILTVAISLGLATLSFRYIEVPVAEFGKRLAKRL